MTTKQSDRPRHRNQIRRMWHFGELETPSPALLPTSLKAPQLLLELRRAERRSWTNLKKLLICTFSIKDWSVFFLQIKVNVEKKKNPLKAACRPPRRSVAAFHKTNRMIDGEVTWAVASSYLLLFWDLRPNSSLWNGLGDLNLTVVNISKSLPSSTKWKSLIRPGSPCVCVRVCPRLCRAYQSCQSEPV